MLWHVLDIRHFTPVSMPCIFKLTAATYVVSVVLMYISHRLLNPEYVITVMSMCFPLLLCLPSRLHLAGLKGQTDLQLQSDDG